MEIRSRLSLCMPIYICACVCDMPQSVEIVSLLCVFFSLLRGECSKVWLFLSCRLGLWVLFLGVPCGVHWRVEKKGEALAKSLAQRQILVLNSQQWPFRCSSYAVLVLEWFTSTPPHRQAHLMAAVLATDNKDAGCLSDWINEWVIWILT